MRGMVFDGMEKFRTVGQVDGDAGAADDIAFVEKTVDGLPVQISDDPGEILRERGQPERFHGTPAFQRLDNDVIAHVGAEYVREFRRGR